MLIWYESNFGFFNRTLGKASCGSECRLYSAIPKLKSSDNSSEVAGSPSEESEKSRRNARASYICGQDIHGDAILASVGYRWKSDDLDYDHVTVKSFYRSLFSSTNFCLVFYALILETLHYFRL